MKIAMIGHKRIPSREGGIEIVVTELASRMAALGNSVTAYNRAGSHVSGSQFATAEKQKEYKGVKIITSMQFSTVHWLQYVHRFHALMLFIFTPRALLLCAFCRNCSAKE